MMGDLAWVLNCILKCAEHAQQEFDTIRAEPFLGTKHIYRKKRFCLQGEQVDAWWNQTSTPVGHISKPDLG